MLSNLTEYVRFLILSGPVMSDDERDKIDTQIQAFIHECADHVKNVQRLTQGSSDESE